MADRLKQYGYFVTLSTDILLFCVSTTDVRYHLTDAELCPTFQDSNRTFSNIAHY